MVILDRPSVQVGSKTCEWPAARLPLLLTLSIPVVIAVLVVLQVRAEWRRVMDEVEINTVTLAHVLAEHTDRLLESADLVRLQTEALLGPDGIEDPSFETFIQMRRLVSAIPHVASIWVGNAGGDAILTSREYPAPALNAADRDYFTAVRDNPDSLYIGKLPDNRYVDQVLINTSRQLADNRGNFRGFVQVAVVPEVVQHVFRRVQLAHQASLWWFGPDGQPLMREPSVPIGSLNDLVPTSIADLGQARQGSFEAPSRVDGTERIFYFTRSSVYDNTILIGIERSALTAMWWQRALPTLALGSLLIVAALTILAFAWREQLRARAYARELEGAVAARTRDLKEAIDQKELVLQEMRHRVGNAYATIQALAQQTLRKSDDLESFQVSFSSRLRALAGTQTMLVEAPSRQAELKDLVWVELGPYRERGSQGIEVAGPPVTLDSNRAIAAGLILHELVTNAIKHGALSVAEGRVQVRWRIEDRRLKLHWKEAGGPPVAQDRKPGFGSDMLTRAAALCDGEITVRHPVDGVEADLILPL